jgi:hypothetical protein
MQTLGQWRAQDYPQTMRNYGVLWNGLESLLNLYGLDVANSLTAADVTATANDGTHAIIKLDMTFAGQPLSGEWPMVKQAGHWYDAALLQAWQKAHPAAASSASATSAASTAPPAASSTATPTAPASSAKPAPSSATQR